MYGQVSANKDTMFQDTTLKIRKSLDLMCKQSHNTLLGRVRRMYEAIARDYQALIGPEAGRDRAAGEPENLARKKVEDLILQSDIKQLESGLLDGSGKMVEGEPEADVEDATEPLIELSSDGLDEDGMAEVEPEM